MKKILIVIGLVLLMSGQSFGATWYIDKRAETNGDGSQESPYNTIDDKVLRSAYALVDPTIEIVANSGPYYRSDFTWSLYPGRLLFNHKAGGTVTWNGNGNSFRSDYNLMDGTYEWHESSTTGLYYCTGTDGVDPAFPTAVVSGIVDGVWDALSTSLFEAYEDNTPHHVKKWGYGDEDSLEFSTVYVRGVNPIAQSPPIYVSLANTYVEFYTDDDSPGFIINDSHFYGGGAYCVYSAQTIQPVSFNYCSFTNADQDGVRTKTAATYNYCKFTKCGHKGFSSVYADQEAYNCHFDVVHLITQLSNSTARTITVKNCTSYNLLAGAFQNDFADNVFTESNNQFHLDPLSAHGSQALAFTAGTPQWTTTDSTDFPPSTDTSLTTSASPIKTNLMDNGVEVSGVNERDDFDYYGKYPYGPVDIGLKQTWGTPKQGMILRIGGCW